MYSLSLREKKLLTLIVVLLAFVSWYKIFFTVLVPRYHKMLEIEQQAIVLEQNLSELRVNIETRKSMIEQVQKEVENLRGNSTPRIRFLLYDLGKAAGGGVSFSEIDIRGTEFDSYFDVAAIAIGAEGHYQAIMDFVSQLESLPGISLRKVELNDANDEGHGAVKASLVFYHYGLHGKEIFPEETGFIYKPYREPNPVEALGPDPQEGVHETIRDESTLSVQESVMEEPEPVTPWPLEPYVFPVK